MDDTELVITRLTAAAEATRLALTNPRTVALIASAARHITAALTPTPPARPHKVRLCGNGGSYADALHIAGEFQATFLNRDRPSCDVDVLATNPAYLTAIANDFAYEDIFARQADTLTSGDVLLCLTTSGLSRNVIAAAEHALTHGATVIALTGSGGFAYDRPPVHLTLRAHCGDVARVQEQHLIFGHIIAELVERALFTPSHTTTTTKDTDTA